MSPRSSSELGAPSLSLSHKQSETSYHLTSPWELGPNSPNGKPAGPVFWNEINQPDLIHGCRQTTLHLPLAQTRKMTFLSFQDSRAKREEEATGRSQSQASGEDTDCRMSLSLFFNKLFRLVIAFLPRSEYLLISWLQSPSAVILEPPKNKVCYCFHCFPIYLP